MALGYYFGIDVGGTSVKMSLYSEKEDAFIKKWSIKSGKFDDENILIDSIIDSMKQVCAEEGLDFKASKGIGIGIPGPVTDDGTVLNCVNLGWGILKLKEILVKKTGISNIEVGNDANVAALGEMWKGAGKGYKSVMMVTLGTGVGGGLVIDGHIHAGNKGAAGEIGHITVEAGEEDTCGCGCKGCLEQYASATGIVRMARKMYPETYKEDVTAKDIFDAAKEGCEKAENVVEKFASYLGTALSNVANVVSPEVFIIGGGVAAAGQIITEKVSNYYRQYSMYALKDTDIRLAALGNDAGIYGCVKMVIKGENR